MAYLCQGLVTLMASTFNSSTGVLSNLLGLVVVFVMSLNSASILSKKSSRIYYGTENLIEVVQNLIGSKATFLFNLCVALQHIFLPLIYLLIIVYVLNQFIFETTTKNNWRETLISTVCILVPSLLLSIVSFGKLILYLTVGNFFTFFLSISMNLVDFFINFLPTVKSVDFSISEM